MSSTDQKSPSMFDGMRRLAAGVSIITSVDASGARYAMTATSVTSVSAEPPSLLVCVNENASLHRAMSESDYFCVNLLSPQHQQISVNCAIPENGESRFETGQWQLDSETGITFLSDAEAVFFCRKQAAHTYGTHDIFIGDVLRTKVASGEPNVLAYLNGQYVEL